MLHRRDALLKLGRLGGLSLPGLLAGLSNQNVRAATDGPAPTGLLQGKSLGKARSCILIYLWGGPPQQDMWDLKPHAPEGIRSLFSPIDTVVPGIQICDQMPQIARHADKLAIVRSMTHPSSVHEASVYHTLTGRANPGLAIPRNARNRGDFPCPGAIVSRFSPPGSMPASVTIPRPIGHDGIVYSGTYAGFLGAAHDPLELRPSGEENAKAPRTFDLPEGLDSTRLAARFGLLQLLEDADRQLQSGQAAAVGGPGQFRDQAFRLLASPQAKQAFDLDREPEALRDRYGRNEYGEAFLLARRLVDAGVRLVTLVWYYICPDGNVANVWDNHGGTGSLGGLSGFDMLKAPYCIPPLDQGFSALLEDLSSTGLLDETVLAMFGEFGRTPKINAAAGRDHWGPCQSVVFAGGGIRGGQVFGASDEHAAYPKQNPVSPEDVLATLYQALGLAPDSEIRDPLGRPYRISEGMPILPLFE